jgi:hypothetical protein
LRAFQNTARALIHINNQGLIDYCKPHFETHTGKNWYALVSVGDLTYKGDQFLNSNKLDARQEPSLVIQELIMGDKFEQISNSTIVNRSLVENAFNQTSEQLGEETAKALIDIATFVDKSQDVAAGSLLNNFMGELESQEPNKGKLQQYWNGLLAILPNITELAEAFAKVGALFVK